MLPPPGERGMCSGSHCSWWRKTSFCSWWRRRRSLYDNSFVFGYGVSFFNWGVNDRQGSSSFYQNIGWLWERRGNFWWICMVLSSYLSGLVELAVVHGRVHLLSSVHEHGHDSGGAVPGEGQQYQKILLN
jgi:hypothetical protein